MKSSKFTFKVQYDGDIVTCTITFDFPLSRQEIKRFKKIFIEKRDINREKLSRYKKVLDRFIANRRKLTDMLHSSEVKYTKLPFKNQSEITFKKTLKEDSLMTNGEITIIFFTKSTISRDCFQDSCIPFRARLFCKKSIPYLFNFLYFPILRSLNFNLYLY